MYRINLIGNILLQIFHIFFETTQFFFVELLTIGYRNFRVVIQVLLEASLTQQPEVEALRWRADVAIRFLMKRAYICLHTLIKVKLLILRRIDEIKMNNYIHFETWF